jgi:hypothetical protein
MKKPLQPHLLKRVPPACKGERTMRWRGRPPIGGQENDRVSYLCSAPYTLLPLRGISPQGETRNLRRKTESHILNVPLRHSPFGGWRHHLSPASGGTITRAYCRAAYEARLRGVLFCPLHRGKSGAARIGGGERSEPITRMLIIPYDTKSQYRNADFISIARRAIRNPQRRRRCRPLSEANTTCRRQAATTLGAKPRQPSPLNLLNPHIICLEGED